MIHSSQFSCRSAHSGPGCEEPVRSDMQASVVPAPTDPTTIEEQFILDQSGTPDSHRTLFAPVVNKCDLPEYHYTSGKYQFSLGKAFYQKRSSCVSELQRQVDN